MWLHLTPHSQSQVKINWGGAHDRPLPTYVVQRGVLDKQVTKTRDALDELAQVYAAQNPGDIEKAVRKVAREGRKLRFVLFDGTLEPADRTLIESWIAREMASQDGVLNVYLGPETCFPIGLCFECDETKMSFDELIDGFWNTSLSVVYRLNSQPIHNLEEPLKRADFSMVSVVNREVLATAQNSFDTASGLSEALEGVLEHPVGSAFTSDAMETLIEQAKDNHTLLHFFCHCEEEELHLGDGDIIDYSDLAIAIDDLAMLGYDQHRTTLNLLFLNACETGINQYGDSFLNLATRDGICGMITTEARVPTPFAAHYGTELLSKLVEHGQTVGDAMAELHRTHWPFSLLYSCYAAREFAVEKAA